MDSLELLLHDEISQASLLVHLISEPVELVEKVFLLCLHVLELLEFDFVLPLSFFIGAFNASNLFGTDFEVLFNPDVIKLLFTECHLLSLGAMQGFGNVFVSVVVPAIFFLGSLRLYIGCA